MRRRTPSVGATQTPRRAPPLFGVGEWRELPSGNQAVQHRAGHIGAQPIRHGDGELSCTAPAKGVAAVWARGAKEANDDGSGKGRRVRVPNPESSRG
jgi:hypothetical protein